MIGKSCARWIDWLLAKPLRNLLEKPQKILRPYVQPGMTVIDVGCGEGLHSIAMARLVGAGGRVVSVDPKAGAIQSLKQRAARLPVASCIEPRICSKLDLAVADLAGQVDFALAVYVVHHAKDVACLMKNVHQALRPGGMFLIIEPRHHASVGECQATEAAATEAGFVVLDHPRLRRDWAVRLTKSK
jgi:SAM-dependent methyltransferase